MKGYLSQDSPSKNGSGLTRRTLNHLMLGGITFSKNILAQATAPNPSVPASYPMEKILDNVYHLPPEYIQAVREFAKQALQAAKNDATPRDVTIVDQEINRKIYYSPQELLQHISLDNEYITDLIVWYITFTMVNADSFHGSMNSEEICTSDLLISLENSKQYWDTNHTMRLVLLMDAALNKAKKDAHEMYPQGEFTPLPGYEDTNPAFLEAVSRLYPARKILVAQGLSMQGEMNFLPEIGSEAEKVYQRKIQDLLYYVLVNISDTVIAESINVVYKARFAASQSTLDLEKMREILNDLDDESFAELLSKNGEKGIKTMAIEELWRNLSEQNYKSVADAELSIEDIEIATDALFGHIGTMLFPGYNPDEVSTLSTQPSTSLLSRLFGVERRKSKSQLLKEIAESVRKSLASMQTAN